MSQTKVLFPRITRETILEVYEKYHNSEAFDVLKREQPGLVVYADDLMAAFAEKSTEINWMCIGMALAYVSLKAQMEKGE